MGLIKDIKDILLACQTKQHKYKYELITVDYYNQKTHALQTRFELIKFHKENIDNKRKRVKDDLVVGRPIEILNYLSLLYALQ